MLVGRREIKTFFDRDADITFRPNFHSLSITAKAVRQRLIASKLTESDLLALVAMHTRSLGSIPGTSVALSRALAQALANRFEQ